MIWLYCYLNNKTTISWLYINGNSKSEATDGKTMKVLQNSQQCLDPNIYSRRTGKCQREVQKENWTLRSWPFDFQGWVKDNGRGAAKIGERGFISGKRKYFNGDCISTSKPYDGHILRIRCWHGREKESKNWIMTLWWSLWNLDSIL